MESPPSGFWKWRYESRLGKAPRQAGGKKGWQLARINGSHHIYIMDGRIERLVIPIHGNQPLKTGLQRALMKLIPVTEEEL